MFKLLIFAGTTEGRELIEALSKAEGKGEFAVFACVATAYGKALLTESLTHPERIKVIPGRLTEDKMVELMKERRFNCVIDTTHPYAKVVTENIKSACTKTGCNYIRVVRSSRQGSSASEQLEQQCIFFYNHKEVIAYLNQHTGKVLMTIGSKELEKYAKVDDYSNRLFVRVLPMTEVLESCYRLGFQGRQLIAMQGPFSFDLNVATMKQIGATFIVAKDSGDPGGFDEKLQAAKAVGGTLLVIGREDEESGFSLRETLNFLEEEYGLSLSKAKTFETNKIGIEGNERVDNQKELGQWFPLFTNISEKHVVVVGAGKIAKRRILTLSKFHCHIKVIAIEALPEVVELAETGRIDLSLKPYDSADLRGADMALAATNNPKVNNEIYDQCKEVAIMVNVANDKEKSDFYFPGIIRKDGLTIGVTAEGKNHSLAKKATKAISDINFLKGE